MEFELKSVQEDWEAILDFISTNFGKRPSDVDSVLFIIGVQELGKGHQFFTKEQKQDLLHIATCKVLSFSNFYELEGLDARGLATLEINQTCTFLTFKGARNFTKGPYHSIF